MQQVIRLEETGACVESVGKWQSWMSPWLKLGMLRRQPKKEIKPPVWTGATKVVAGISFLNGLNEK